MNDIDKGRIVERYNARLAQFGYDIRSLASGTEERRQERFRVLREVGIHDGCSVLDLGCGFGDFWRYLQGAGLNVNYTGYDINPELIQIAQRENPGIDFKVLDIQSADFPTFDFIVSCNAFNLRLQHEDNYQFVANILAVCQKHAAKGVAIDFLTSYADIKAPEAFYYEPERLFAIAKNLTKRVCLRHDYPLFEFCLYLYPDFKGWRSHA